MAIKISGKTKSPAAMKLYNHIASFLFEEEYGELKSHPVVKEILKNANKELAKLFKNG